MRKKVIRITLTLNDGVETFTADGDNRLSSSGLAISCVITHGNGAMSPTAQITVYNLPLEVMVKLFRVQWNTMQALLNTVKIEVGEQGDKTLTTAYDGNITFATTDMASSPNTALIITSQMAMVEKFKVTPPFTSPKDEVVDSADIIKFLAEDMGFSFQNFGASKQLTNASLNGSNLEKIQTLAQWCDFDLYVEDKSITICKKDGERDLKIPVVSPTTGMDNYPVLEQRGIAFNCIYDPSIRFGGVVRVKDSLITTANADWRIYGLVTTLEANKPQGKWHMSVNATWRNSKDAAVQRK